MRQGTQELKDLDVDRVDGVDKPATDRNFLRFKSEDGASATMKGYGATATAGKSPAPPTPSGCSNLSTPLKSVGQVASPGTATQFTVGCLIQVVDMLRRLDERAKAEAETSASVAGPRARENHGADRAGSPADPGPLGTPTGHRGAPGNQDEEQIEPSP